MRNTRAKALPPFWVKCWPFNSSQTARPFKALLLTQTRDLQPSWQWQCQIRPKRRRVRERRCPKHRPRTHRWAPPEPLLKAPALTPPQAAPPTPLAPLLTPTRLLPALPLPPRPWARAPRPSSAPLVVLAPPAGRSVSPREPMRWPHLRLPSPSSALPRSELGAPAMPRERDPVSRRLWLRWGTPFERGIRLPFPPAPAVHRVQPPTPLSRLPEHAQLPPFSNCAEFAFNRKIFSFRSKHSNSCSELLWRRHRPEEFCEPGGDCCCVANVAEATPG